MGLDLLSRFPVGLVDAMMVGFATALSLYWPVHRVFKLAFHLVSFLFPLLVILFQKNKNSLNNKEKEQRLQTQ